MTLGASFSYAQSPSDKVDPYRSTTFPLPRFASIAQEKAFVRAGPGKKYPIKFIIEKPGLPVEITLEFDSWRKIKDISGQEGWVFRSLLSGKRTAIITGVQPVSLHKHQDIKANYSFVTAMLEPSVIVNIQECEGDACLVEAQGFAGWIERKSLWGVYVDENFD